MTPVGALWLSVGAALATMALKGAAWWATGSVGFLSDAMESMVNLAGASFALAMVAYARRPADHGHPYGHGKAEYFSSAFEGALIALAAGAIVLAATRRLIDPQPLEALGVGAALSSFATAINFAVARVLLRVGREHRSLAAEADGRHLMTDVWTSLGVIVGVAIAGWSGLLWVDPVVALLVGANILREGWQLVSRSVAGLMDAALPDEEIREIEAALAALQSPPATFGNLRTRRSGVNRFAFIELRVPSDWSVERADAFANTAERALDAKGITLVVRVKPG